MVNKLNPIIKNSFSIRNNLDNYAKMGYPQTKIACKNRWLQQLFLFGIVHIGTKQEMEMRNEP
jgi:hypothetical protein